MNLTRCLPSAIVICCVALVVFATTAGCLDSLPRISGNHAAINDGKLSAYFFDVGQGDSTLFVLDNKTILIDSGEVEMGDRVAGDLARLGISRIDLLVLTHPHSDHIGGARQLVRSFPIGLVLDTGLPHTGSSYEHLLEAIEEKKIPYLLAKQGQEIDVVPGLSILVHSPPSRRCGDDPNANSIVIRVSYGSIDFLMTGDIGGEAENELANSDYALDAEILKVAHHGSESSTSESFLGKVHPEVAVIHVGTDNPYGHPHRETLSVLKDYGVMIYRTDTDGTIRVRTDGNSYMVTTERAGTGFSQVAASRAVPLENVTFSPVSIPPLPTLPPDLLPPSVESFLPQIGNASAVVIGAVRFDAPGDDRTNLNGEWVQLENTGTDTVLLNRWTLSDQTGSFSYVFPAYTLEPGSSLTVYTGTGLANNTALFMGLGSPVWGNDGDTAVLRNFRDEVIARKVNGGTA